MNSQVMILRDAKTGWHWARIGDDVAECEHGFDSYAETLRDAQTHNGPLLPTDDPDIYDLPAMQA